MTATKISNSLEPQTPFERWQLEKYGSFIPEGGTSSIENGHEEREKSDRVCELIAELSLAERASEF
jgi:hypothetical protein